MNHDVQTKILEIVESSNLGTPQEKSAENQGLVPHTLRVFGRNPEQLENPLSRGRLEQTLKRQLSFTEVRRLKMADPDEILKNEKTRWPCKPGDK